MSRAEGIHYVAVGIRSQRLGKLLLALLHGLLGLLVGGVFLVNAYGLAFLLGIVTQVLQQQGLAHLQCLGSILSLSTVGSECHGHTQCLGHCILNLAQRELRVYLTLGLAHMAHDDDGTAVGQNLLQCGQRTADAGVVRNLTVLVQGHIEIDPDNCLLTGKVVLIDCHNRI